MLKNFFALSLVVFSKLFQAILIFVSLVRAYSEWSNYGCTPKRVDSKEGPCRFIIDKAENCGLLSFDICDMTVQFGHTHQLIGS